MRTESDVDPREQLAEQLTFLIELGVDGFSRDPAWRGSARDQQIAQGFSPAPGSPESLPSIRTDLGDCTRCKLATLGRRQIVFGVGNPRARLMFIGEAPGRDEDIQGIPFVGRAGQLLTKMIEAIGLKREDVYIANVIKCRPPENRNPEPDEVASCEPFLFRQVESISPVVIVALGTFAAQALLKSQDTILEASGPCLPLRRRSTRADVSPRLPPAKPGQEARRVGGPQASQEPARRRRGGHQPAGVACTGSFRSPCRFPLSMP